MQIEVHIRNGRTALRFKNRALLREVLGNKPDHEGRRVIAEIKHNRDDPEWMGCSVRYISPNSISYVIEVPKDEAVQGGVEDA